MKKITMMLVLFILISVLIPFTAFSKTNAGNIFWKVLLTEEWIRDVELSKDNSKVFTNTEVPDVNMFVIYSHSSNEYEDTLDSYFLKNTPYSLVGDFLLSMPSIVRLWAIIEIQERADFGNTFGNFFHIVLKNRFEDEYVHVLWAITFRRGSYYEVRVSGKPTAVERLKPKIKEIIRNIEIFETPLGK